MENKKNEQKTAQILYITIMLVLLIMALAVGLVSAANRRRSPSVTSDIQTTEKAPVVSTAVSDIDHTSPSVTTAKIPEMTKAPIVTSAPATSASEKAAQAEVPNSVTPEFIMPTIGDVSKKFSIDVLVYSSTMEDYRTHNGIDIVASLGEGVMAAADGIVKEIYEHPMMGNTVVISHEGDMISVYQNLADEIPVSVGDSVKSGEVIGAIGDSAIIEIAEEPHLHFEIMVSGEHQDPLDYISTETMTTVYEE